MALFEFKPFVSVGKITFNMSRNNVRELLGRYVELPDKPTLERNIGDNFNNCHVDYDLENKVEAITIFNEGHELLYEGKNLLAMTQEEFIKYFDKYPIELEKEYSGSVISVIIDELGIAADVINVTKIGSISLFRKGTSIL